MPDTTEVLCDCCNEEPACGDESRFPELCDGCSTHMEITCDVEHDCAIAEVKRAGARAREMSEAGLLCIHEAVDAFNIGFTESFG